MKSRTLGFALTIALLTTGTAATADEMVSFATGGYASQLRTPEMMHKIDTNQDGMVSQSEWDAYQQKLFDMMDTGKTRMLGQNEFFGRGPRH
jgi:hypothetical protein